MKIWNRMKGMISGLALLVLPSAMAVPLTETAFENNWYPRGAANTNWLPVATTSLGFQSAVTSAFTRVEHVVYGQPIGSVPSAFSIGQPIDPPEGYQPDSAPMLDFFGGSPNMVWIDYANLLLATDMGAAQVSWVMADGTTNSSTLVVSPNPDKRPVRLYWTEGQYAGPLVKFGQNYEVTLYNNSQLSTNDVWLADNMLHAARGAQGRMLVSYSRIDETSGLRELLDYEIVEVMQPMSSLQKVAVGERLLPMTRRFSTEELFSEISRGAVDETGENPDDIFVYKHSAGEKMGWIWAIRETAEPWQVEIYWKAKEAMDVIWPFEVDIYDVEWGETSQRYLCGHPAEGAAPGTLFPTDLTVEMMPWQEPAGHAKVSADSGFSAKQPGYCLLKYSAGDNVWFEAVRSVWHDDAALFSSSNHTWLVGDELRPVQAEHETIWPAYIRVPEGDGYHAGLYAYPTTYPKETTNIASYAYAVNEGLLECWWANQSVQDTPTPVYWLSQVNRYQAVWPKDGSKIVIASFEGTRNEVAATDGTGCFRGAPASRASMPDDGRYALTNAFTIEAWVKPDNTTGRRMIAARSPAYCFILNSGRPALNMGSTSDSWHMASQSLPLNEWSHVSVTFEPVNAENHTLRFYLNGELIHTEEGLPARSAQPEWTSWPNSLFIGQTPLGEMPFTGWIDEVRVWNYPRSEAELLTSFRTVVAANSVGLVGYFRFGSELASNVLADWSDRSRVGTATAGSYTNVGQTVLFENKSYSGLSPVIYTQNNPELPGYNPNEEHGLVVAGEVFALRNDLNSPTTSKPFVVVEYADARLGRTDLDVYEVLTTNETYQFVKNLDAGLMIQPPEPLCYMVPSVLSNSYVAAGPYFRDRKKSFWAKQAGDDGGPTNVVMRFFYPNQAGFYYPFRAQNSQPAAGEEIPWLSGANLNGTPVDMNYTVSWPEDVPSLYVGDTLTTRKKGLPDIRGQLSAEVVYQQQPSVTLLDPTVRRKTGLAEIPPGMAVQRDPRTGFTHFQDLPPELRNRLFYNPFAATGNELQLAGKFMERTDGHNYLRLNVLTDDQLAQATDEAQVRGIENGDEWHAALARLNELAPVVLHNDEMPFDSLALSTLGTGTGYVTVVFNDSTNQEMVDKTEMPGMAVIKVEVPLYVGKLDIAASENPLDKMQTLFYTADFAGEPEKYRFRWESADPENGMAPATNSSAWSLHTEMNGANRLVVGDVGVYGLADHYLRCTYRPLDPVVQAIAGSEFTLYTEPVLCEGWIKRVVKAINPFDQRIRDFMNYDLNTQLSMVQQVGKPYAGTIPMNMDALNDCGLLEIYQTILELSKDLSIDADIQATEAVSLALMLVAGRANDMYTILGNEAYADALNPLIDLGSAGIDLGTASSIFAFQNQQPDLLSEELALLRGRDDSLNPPISAYPHYNRLPWNFTSDIMHGQVAYVLNYGISDLKGDQNGFVDVADAQALYPQGHGDAWGHYLSATKAYYTLLHNENFSWLPQIEGILAGDTEITVSFLHEIKFAQAAAAKARVGAAIVDRTSRQRFDADDQMAWKAQRDSNTDRAWGVGEWGCRAGMGAYFDWVTANALLPDRSIHATNDLDSIQVIDRTTVLELPQISDSYRYIQQKVDLIDAGLNPLGLAPDAVSFDISPSEIDAGKTHFEQTYAKSHKALKSALAVFDRIKASSQAMRDQSENRDFDAMVATEEAAYERRLIEIYGYPYADDLGAGKLYAQDYNGPDLIHFNYIELHDLDGINEYGGRKLTVPIESASSTGIITKQIDLSKKLNKETGAVRWVLGDWLGLDAGGTVESIGSETPVSFATDFAGDWLSVYKSINVNVHEMNYTTNDYTFWLGPDGIPGKPSTYTGYRRAEGKIQIALSKYVEALRNLKSSIEKVRIGAACVRYEADYCMSLLNAKISTYNKNIELANDINTFEQTKVVLTKILDKLSKADEATDKAADAAAESLPTSVGLAVDATAPARGAAKIAATVKKALTTVGKLALQGTIWVNEKRIKSLQRELEFIASTADIQVHAREAIYKVDGEITKYDLAYTELESNMQAVETARMEYANMVAEGDRVQMEREAARRTWASELSMDRYRNMAYQIFRNDALVRYEQAFDNAARYVYLTAQAYDYESGLLHGDAQSTGGKELLESVVKARSLGCFSSTADRTPQLGGSAADPGLADVMARMDANWDVLEGRLNFNNPQFETGRFSLRQELFRIMPGNEGDEAWRTTLASYVVPDLKAVPEFRRYCLPFEPMATVEPGLVIPFSSTIDFRKNFFGHPLAGGDNAYDSSHFSTKIRGVGIWLSNFNNAFGSTVAGMANQPRVYLVPVGMDMMRVPDGEGTAIRSWKVADQALPVPYAFSDADFGSPDWSVLKDVLSNDLYKRRRFASLLANHDADALNINEVSFNSRLIGRSVWNTRWLLIIPGGTLLNDADEGIERFINGAKLPGDLRDGNGVEDIRLIFSTYSYSGE